MNSTDIVLHSTKEDVETTSGIVKTNHLSWEIQIDNSTIYECYLIKFTQSIFDTYEVTGDFLSLPTNFNKYIFVDIKRDLEFNYSEFIDTAIDQGQTIEHKYTYAIRWRKYNDSTFYISNLLTTFSKPVIINTIDENEIIPNLVKRNATWRGPKISEELTDAFGEIKYDLSSIYDKINVDVIDFNEEMIQAINDYRDNVKTIYIFKDRLAFYARGDI